MVTAIICTGHRHALSCGSCPPYRMTARALHTHACCNSYTAHTWDSSIFSLIGFGAGGSGIVGALAGLLACVGSSLVICCGPKSTAEGPGKFTAVRRAHSWLRRRTLTLHEPQMGPSPSQAAALLCVAGMLQALMALVTIILMGVVLSEIDKEAERIGATVNEDAKVSLGIYLCRPSVPAANRMFPSLASPYHPTPHTLAHPPYPCPPTTRNLPRALSSFSSWRRHFSWLSQAPS